MSIVVGQIFHLTVGNRRQYPVRECRNTSRNSNIIAVLSRSILNKSQIQRPCRWLWGKSLGVYSGDAHI
jgi:hypothetical protein